MIIGTCIMYRVQTNRDYGVGVTGSYWGHLDSQVRMAPQYLNPTLSSEVFQINSTIKQTFSINQ